MKHSHSKPRSLSKEEGEKLIAHLKQKNSQRKNSRPFLNSNVHPVSNTQKNIWLSEQLDETSTVYNIPVLWQLNGHLDITSLEKAIHEIIKQHAILRTIFKWSEEKQAPVQRILPQAECALKLIDLSSMPENETERRKKALGMADQHWQQPFDLQHGLLMRAMLIKTGPQEHFLLFVFHHLIFDGYSDAIFHNHLSQLYHHFLTTPLREVINKHAIDYVDFIYNEVDSQSPSSSERAAHYWKEKLNHAPSWIDFPTDIARSSRTTCVGERQTLHLPPLIFKKMQEVSRQENITLFMILLAGLTLLVSKLSDQKDCIISAPIANRDTLDTARIIGPCFEVLHLRSHIDQQVSFLTFLKDIRKTTLEAYQHRRVPCFRNEPATHETCQRPIQFLLNYLNYPQENLALTGLETQRITDKLSVLSKHDFTVYAYPHEGSIALDLVYKKDLFHADRIAIMLQQYYHLLEQGMQEPHIPIERMALLPREKQLQLPDPTLAINAPDQVFVLETIFSIAESFPHHNAIEQGEFSMTYQTLSQWITRTAHALMNDGINPNDVTAIHGDKRWETIVILLAVLKIGAVIVPMDSSLPCARKHLMLRESSAKQLIQVADVEGLTDFQGQTIKIADNMRNLFENQTSETKHCAPAVRPPSHINHALEINTAKNQSHVPNIDLLSTIPNALEANLFEHPCDDLETNPAKNINPTSKADPSEKSTNRSTISTTNHSTSLEAANLSQTSPAYIFFTSGSTGIPKGIIGTHKGLAHFIHWEASHFNVGPTDKVSLFTGLSFDVVLRDIFLPLCSGATLCIPPPNSQYHATDIFHWMEASRISIIHAVPSIVLSWLSSNLPSISLKHLRLILFAGEPLLAELIHRWRKQFPDCSADIINLYGPTETTLAKCFYKIPQNPLPGIQPVGKPLPHTQVFVLRDGKFLCSIGERGEVVIRTPFRTLGYLKQISPKNPFYPNPFSTHQDDILYRTGDIGEYLPGGDIKIYGRSDDAIKIRGVRITLGDVSAALLAHPLISSGTIHHIKDEQLNSHLIAYYVPAKGSSLDTSALREFLLRTLPLAMMPAAFVPLDELPLLPNGKIDRKRLPPPTLGSSLQNCIETPTTLSEELIISLWESLLNRHPIGLTDDFFLLGGNSLIATQIVARLSQLFNITLKPRDIFQHSTPKQLGQWVKTCQASHDPEPVLNRQPRDIIIASFSQERMYFLDQLEENVSVAYNIPWSIQLKGPLNRDALIKSLQEIVARHESLRTTLSVSADNKTILQSITANLPLPFHALDCQDSTTQTVAQNWEDCLEKETTTPFHLSLGPLIRITLLKISAHTHLLHIVLHHAIADGWSFGVFMKELAILYNAFKQDNPSPLSPLPFQYQDYTYWQRECVKMSSAKHIDYWKQQLSDAPDILPLPTDYPRPLQQTYRGRRSTVALCRLLEEKINDFSRQENLSPFMVYLAGFSLLLSRYSNENDICIGSPIANRTHPALENMIGCFVNTVCLRIRLGNNPTVKDFLCAIRETCLDAQEHAALPFEQLLKALNLHHATNRSPLFQVMFVFQNTPYDKIELNGLEVKPIFAERGTAKFDLTLTICHNTETAELQLEYNSDLFKQETIQKLLSHYALILEKMIETPRASLADINVLHKSEQDKIIYAFNATKKTYLHSHLLHALIEKQCALTPDRIAVKHRTECLTYSELNGRANQLARHLRQQGIGPEKLVGIFMERSLHAIIAMLGVLKAGGAYVPLDPTYPPERITQLIHNTSLSILLTHHALNPPSAVRTIQIDADWDTIASEPPTHLTNVAVPSNLAYVIFTSGSTGQPKGAMLTHAGICNRLLWMQEQYHITETETILQKTPFVFDVSVWELFLPLITGATLVFADPDKHKDNDYLTQCIQAEKITTLHFVPTMLQSFLASEGVEACKTLKNVICSGETLHASLVKTFYKKFPSHARLHNLYGPTEASVDVSHWTCDPATLTTTIPIGSPIANIQLHILDANLHPTPINTKGDLYIGGIGLARGYMNNPDITAAAFIPNPFSKTGERLYKTGDIARYHEDASIEFLGRADHQIKLRGFRIEMGEIEATLREHPAVQDALVIVTENDKFEKTLVAYVINKADNTLNASHLSTFLQSKLPHFLIPSLFLFLDQFPLSTNGKIDRKRLPAPEPLRSGLGVAYVPPSTPHQTLLVDIWRDVLEIDGPIGIDDNYFAIGGDSIKSIRIIASANQKNIHMSLDDIFQLQTIRCIAERISTRQHVVKKPLTQGAFGLLSTNDLAKLNKLTVNNRG